LRGRAVAWRATIKKRPWLLEPHWREGQDIHVHVAQTTHHNSVQFHVQVRRFGHRIHRWREPVGPYLARTGKLVDAVKSMPRLESNPHEDHTEGRIDPEAFETEADTREGDTGSKQLAKQWCTDKSLHVGKQVCNLIE